MKTIYFLPLLLLLAGCGTNAGTDPLAQFYQPYQGSQTNWPTGPGSFVTDRFGVVFYHGPPNFPYTIVGRYDRPNLPLNKLAVSAQLHGVQSIYLSDEGQITEIHQNPSVAFGGSHVVTAIPGNTYVERHQLATAYLIKPLNPADFTQPTSSPLPLGNTNTNIVHSPRQK
jgi:hypothetical protein